MESLESQLAQLRFRRSGPSSFRHTPFALHVGERWMSLTMSGPLPDGVGQFGTAGPWIRTGSTGDEVVIADLPVSPDGTAFCAGGGALPETAFIAAIEWLVATARDERRPAWEPPSLEDIETWLEPDGLTIQGRCSDHLRQAVLKRAPGVLTLRVEISAAAPKELDQRRLAWCDSLLTGASRQWRMVRAGMSHERAAVAEVDLSGAPHALIERLVRAGMASLRSAVTQVLPSIQYVYDPTQPCRWLDARPTPLVEKPRKAGRSTLALRG